MKKLSLNLSIILFLIASINIASAQEQATVTFTHIIIPEAPPVASVMVAYMQIKNNSPEKKIITQLSSPQFKRVEIHEMSMANGMMNMKQLKSLTIKANQTLVLESGGLHVMLIKPLNILKHGDSIELTIKFASGEITTLSTHVQKSD